MLNIAIPTFNRKKSLEFFFTKNDWIFNSEKIRVFILDNSSTDGTIEFCIELSVNNSNIVIVRNLNHTTAEENVKRAFGLNIKGWLWILGDRYYVSKSEVDRLFKLVDECEDCIFLLSLNNINRKDNNLIVKNPEEVIFNKTLMLAASCLSTAIYSEQARAFAVDTATKNKSPFPHTFVIIYSLKRRLELKYISEITVNVIPGKSNWAYTADWVQIGFRGWFNLVDSVCGCEDKTRYLAYKMFPSNTSLGSIRGAVKRRIVGVINFKSIYADRHSIIKGVGMMAFVLMLLISLLPLSIFERILKLNRS
jgi:hypothetical protein